MARPLHRHVQNVKRLQVNLRDEIAVAWNHMETQFRSETRSGGCGLMNQGNIVLLNGTSSAGKTNIAQALQEIMDAPYVYTGIDHTPRVHKKFHAVSDGINPATFDYFLLVYGGGSVRTETEGEGGEIIYAGGPITEVRIGPGGLRLLAGMYRSIAALAAAGIDVVVDDVIYDQRVLKAAVDALFDSPVLFVGLRLPLAEAERRERERGDRGPGGAAAWYELVHAHGIYDLELDTSVASPMECAQKIKMALENGHPRRAFRQLAALGDGKVRGIP
jgi:chloramphenicol 3-O phosphotransferase